MRDIDEGDTFAPQSADRQRQDLCLFAHQGGGWLVEDEDFSASGSRRVSSAGSAFRPWRGRRPGSFLAIIHARASPSCGGRGTVYG
jgi:hypothetical protein